MDQTVLFGTMGLTDRLDFSVSIPISSVRLGVSSNANIIRVSGSTFAISGTTFSNPHSFTPDGNGLQKTFASTGSSSGIGDLSFRLKGSIYQSNTVRIAAAIDIRTPTGDARQFLGTGSTGIKPFIIISGGKRFSPHVNFGYQWNSDSILAGNITGTTIGENANGDTTIQTGPAIAGTMPKVLTYSVGADYGVAKRLSVAIDYLGQTVLDARRIATTTFVTQNIAGGTGTLRLPTIVPVKETVALSSGSIGFKYNIARNLLFTGNVLFKLDHNGLRQNVTPLIALSYSH